MDIIPQRSTNGCGDMVVGSTLIPCRSGPIRSPRADHVSCRPRAWNSEVWPWIMHWALVCQFVSLSKSCFILTPRNVPRLLFLLLLSTFLSWKRVQLKGHTSVSPEEFVRRTLDDCHFRLRCDRSLPGLCLSFSEEILFRWTLPCLSRSDSRRAASLSGTSISERLKPLIIEITA